MCSNGVYLYDVCIYGVCVCNVQVDHGLLVYTVADVFSMFIFPSQCLGVDMIFPHLMIQNTVRVLLLFSSLFILSSFDWFQLMKS